MEGKSVLIMIAAYPAFRHLKTFPIKASFSRSLLILSLTATLFLLPSLVRMTTLQIQGVGEEASSAQWIANVEHLVLLLLAGWLATTKRPGWRVLGISAGLTFFYLGIASLNLLALPGSWGLVGSILAIVGGLGFLVFSLIEKDRVPLRA